MHRFFVSPDQIRDQLVYIEAEQAHHIQRVLRLKPGTVIAVFDGLGCEYQACLEREEGRVLVARILSQIERNSETAIRLHLVQALPKGDKMDYVVQKAVEIGVTGIYPVLSDRSTIKLDEEKAVRKVQRWQTIARESCKQCGRSLIPQVHPIQGLSQWLSGARGTTTIMLYEDARDLGLKQILRKEHQNWSVEINLLIGPEGGFSPLEADQARQAGFIWAGLGSRILRTETAGLVAAALILYEFGELGG
ncbi:MAG TPA: 16S rRNA (uracil(1498)-N(3))-methyltransferase [Syntrophomonadaceae bacterium]|nr:16S rRNA (uracil(1498)-N(3))-methyltransferase [Syntrophomonadaceae bacterium]